MQLKTLSQFVYKIMERMCICATVSLHHRRKRPELMRKVRNKAGLYIALKKVQNYWRPFKILNS